MVNIDFSKVVMSSLTNSFKNTGVYPANVVLSGAIGPGVTVNFSTSVTLPENQTYAFAKAYYIEFAKFGSASWQKIPTTGAYVPTTPTGNLAAVMFTTVNGKTVTFNATMNNPYAGTETITTTTIPITYVTYTVDS